MARKSVPVFLDQVIVALCEPPEAVCCQYLDLTSGRVLVLAGKEKKQDEQDVLGEESWDLIKREPEQFVQLRPLEAQQITPWYWEFANTCCEGEQRRELLQLLEGKSFLAGFYDALDCDDILRTRWRQYETEKVRAYFLTLVPSQVAIEFCSFTTPQETAVRALC